MIYPEIYPNLTYSQKVSFSLIILVIVVMLLIVTKIKNKAKKRVRRQIIYPVLKFDVYEYLMQNFKQEFIGQEKMYINELKRM